MPNLIFSVAPASAAIADIDSSCGSRPASRSVCHSESTPPASQRSARVNQSLASSKPKAPTPIPARTPMATEDSPALDSAARASKETPMPPAPREEILAAFDKYKQARDAASRTGDWSIWAAVFTEDAHYVEHAYGELHGREAIREWIEGVMKPFPTMTFPQDWWVLDEERGAVVFCCQNQFPEPFQEDGTPFQFPNWTRLVYGGGRALGLRRGHLQPGARCGPGHEGLDQGRRPLRVRRSREDGAPLVSAGARTHCPSHRPRCAARTPAPSKEPPMGDVFIVEAARSPLGKRGGSLSTLHPADLLGTVMKGALDRSGLDPAAGRPGGGRLRLPGGRAELQTSRAPRGSRRGSRSRPRRRPSTASAARASRRAPSPPVWSAPASRMS